MVLKFKAAMEIAPVVDQQHIASLLAKLNMQLRPLCYFFEVIQGLDLLVAEIGRLLGSMRPVNQNAQETTCEMALAE
jgi:hypothetical protein